MANENGNIELYNLLHSEGDLWKSAAIAAMKLADGIKDEPKDTDHHEVRMQWAQNVLSNPDGWVMANKWNIIKPSSKSLSSTGLSTGIKTDLSTPMLLDGSEPTVEIPTLNHSSTDIEIESAIATLIPS
jgi:hypothetical protein